ncbi:MAG: tRNA dihydrouridine synthase DusB [Anaerolineae bacterium]|nr:tRNA dihydrouridine synthase DusB [Anaerolineae bacterium]
MTSAPRFTVGSVAVYGDLILAPLAGYSDLPFRSICRSLGSAMSYTEFVSAHGVLRANPRTYELLRFAPRERPVVFQIFGADERLVADACLRLQELGPDIIDVNMGCPSPRIANQGGGAGLLRNPQQIARIFSSLSKCLDVPVTGKIRLGWDEASRNHLQIAHVLEDNGASLIAVHGRTRSASYDTPADWDAIATVKQAVDIPVLGNGDVRCVDDIDRIKAITGCDGVMIGRGAIGNPWLFQRRDLADVSLDERVSMIRHHLQEMVAFYGELRGVLAFRKHIVRYLHGLPGAARLRPLLMKCKTLRELAEQLDVFASHPEHVIIQDQI